MGVLEYAFPLNEIQVNPVRTTAASAVGHRAAFGVPGVEYVIADLQFGELFNGVIAEDTSAAHGMVHHLCSPPLPTESTGRAIRNSLANGRNPSQKLSSMKS
jgi:hypothetical protein